ncbi:MAG TPA: alpha/beta hydrolase [Acidimicrobiales bacterium]|nr:alpha/beta hydrolase [Acidimicrobiales bacterium]
MKVKTNGVELHVEEAGEGFPVILAHGFPELAYSWRHQLPALAAAGYRAVAPDQRGYGKSSRPDDIADYDIIHLTDDIVGVLDAIGGEKAVIVGHDWGSMVATGFAQLHPDRCAGLVNMSVPFLPRGEVSPVTLFKQIFGDSFFYILYFQEPGVADANLGADAGTTMRRMLAGVKIREGDTLDATGMSSPDAEAGFVERLPEPDALPDWLTQEELDFYTAEFTRTGFTGGINWYRNFDRNWERTPQLAGAKVEVPSLFIGGKQDPVVLMSPPGIGDAFLSDHHGNVMVDDAGHWVQQEKPKEVNDALIAFLNKVVK